MVGAHVGVFWRVLGGRCLVGFGRAECVPVASARCPSGVAGCRASSLEQGAVMVTELRRLHLLYRCASLHCEGRAP